MSMGYEKDILTILRINSTLTEIQIIRDATFTSSLFTILIT